MGRARDVIRPCLLALGWSVGAIILAGLFRLAAGRGFEVGAKAAAAVGASTLLLSLVIPAVSLAGALAGESGPLDDLGRWGRGAGAALAGASAGVVLFGLVSAPRAVPEALAALLVVAACAVSFGALARVLRQLVPGRLAGGCLAGAALLALAATPFWSRAFMASAAGAVWGKWLIGASPFLATAMPWVGAEPWAFDPRISPVLYGCWVGTNHPVMFPGWIACAVGHLCAGAVLLSAAELAGYLKGRFGGRRSARAPGQPRPVSRGRDR